jgi:hypothetical protein
MRFKNNEILIKWKNACRKARIYGILEYWMDGRMELFSRSLVASGNYSFLQPLDSRE